ncbi:MAG: 30S ribosomal protein S4 [Planctomycetaceae bacterium]|nr:30S ribosomal protein S4 [Planctomycetota bacterium]NUN51803.1 30S ribosomal protein S4 [Planctomycetaceae bacterium]
MARSIGAKCRLCRREGVMLFLKGQRCLTDKCSIKRRETPPGMHSLRRSRLSAYGTRLREKQKVKRIYGLLERQFRRTFAEAVRMKGNTGENLLVLLERRLDNVVYHLGFGLSRSHARQLVRHGHISVNGRRCNVPSALVRAGDVVGPYNRPASAKAVRESLEQTRGRTCPTWLVKSEDPPSGKVNVLPRREEIPFEINELFIVEVAAR